MLRILKIVDPIIALEPDVPEIKEGDILPIMDPSTKSPHNSWYLGSRYGLAADIFHSLPPVPIDTEYTGNVPLA